MNHFARRAKSKNASVQIGDCGKIMASVVDLKTVVKHLVNGKLDENLCRVCLLSPGDICENIFTKICKLDTEFCIADVLRKVYHMEISDTDNFNVCSDCFIAVCGSYELYLTCQRSTKILNFYINEIEKSIDCVCMPNVVIDNSFCIKLQDYEPDVECFDDNVTNILNKEYEACFETLEDVKTIKIEIDVKDKQKAIKVEPLNNKDDDDEDIIVVINEKGERTHYKLNKGCLELLGHKKKVRRQREPMPYVKCSQCDVHYRFLAKLKEHMKLKHDMDFFICKICKATSENEQEFNTHLKTHTNIHQCAICNAVFKKRDTIIGHLKWHKRMTNLSQTDRAHVCELCGFILPNEEELKDHYDKKHDKKYTCYYCGKMYRGAISFESHIYKHERLMGSKLKRPLAAPAAAATRAPGAHVCATCGKEFVDERALKWHTMLHNNDRPFICDTCGRGFVSVNRRNQHAVCSHSAPTRRCPLCPALFHLRSMVNTHVKKVHLKEHKRRNRTSKHQNVFWKTEAVPIQELSVSIQNEILELKVARKLKEDNGLL